MEILTEWDTLVEAMKKVNLDEEVMPIVNGRVVENVDSYNKMQKILETPELINAHKYVYNLDVENLDEEDVDKIDKIYNLGIERGFIEKPVDNDCQDCNVNGEINVDAVKMTKEPDSKPVVQRYSYKVKIPSWTVLYSGWKDGNVKTGECYSNAINPQAAKADCYAKLTRCGYQNINILAIEAGDPDYCGQEQTIEADENVIENDMLNGRNHNLHIVEDDEKETSEQPKKEEPAKEEPKKEEPKEEEPKEEPAKEEPKEMEIASDPEDSKKEEEPKEEPAEEEPKEEEPKEEPAEEEPKEEPKEEEPKEEPKEEEPKEEPKEEEPKEEPAEEEPKEEEPKEEPAEEQKKEEISDEQKLALKNEYKKLYKQLMLKCNFENKCFDDLTIQEKVKFFTELNKYWSKSDPKEFMSDKEMDQLNKIIIKK